MKDGYTITSYSPEHLVPLVRMWRDSFQSALGLVDPHPIEEQMDYFTSAVLPTHDVRVAIDSNGSIVGFLASTPTTVGQLYIHVQHQRRGIGAHLLTIAKQYSSGTLRLFTFAANTQARDFYRRHGFIEIAYGFEAEWQLADVELEWISHSSTTHGSASSAG